MKDYYRILGLEKNASPEEIRRKFKELALEYHPDVSIYKNANDIFIEINEAYQILSDVNKKTYYDSILQKDSDPGFTNLKEEFETYTSTARQKAREYASKDYRSYIKDLNCFYTEQRKADGIPFNYYMHKTTGISGGVGPMGSIKSRSVCIPIPRSRKATSVHRVGFGIKLFFLLISIVVLLFIYPGNLSFYLKGLYSFLIVITGGILVLIMYKLTGVKSKCLYSKNFSLVKKYRSKGFQRGFHPMISTTPIGIITFILRWIL
ncbi:MAG: J domain-containing protein [Bacteroidales bacterium]|nr:J domain-containing protein [Bacteroidales bacterium]